MSICNFLFVYGSLRSDLDGKQHVLLQNQAKLLGNASIPGLLYDVNQYPGALYLPEQSNTKVHGELYLLLQPETVLAHLDEYEECSAQFVKPCEYERCMLPVLLTNKAVFMAWVYLYNWSVTGLKLIADGDYKNYCNYSP